MGCELDVLISEEADGATVPPFTSLILFAWQAAIIIIPQLEIGKDFFKRHKQHRKFIFI